MICVDTSALMAIILREAEALRCVEALATESEVLISAATIAEAMIVAGQRDLSDEMARLLGGMPLTVIEVGEASAMRSAAAYRRWGKGWNPARLNYGDCFAYEVAQRYGCPLLFVGDDFSQTDVRSAL